MGRTYRFKGVFKGLVILLGRAYLLGYVVFSRRGRVLLAINDLGVGPP